MSSLYLLKASFIDSNAFMGKTILIEKLKSHGCEGNLVRIQLEPAYCENTP